MTRTTAHWPGVALVQVIETTWWRDERDLSASRLRQQIPQHRPDADGDEKGKSPFQILFRMGQNAHQWFINAEDHTEQAAADTGHDAAAADQGALKDAEQKVEVLLKKAGAPAGQPVVEEFKEADSDEP